MPASSGPLDDRTRRIARAFGAAADYDAHAGIQRRVAEGLAARIGATRWPAHARVLEVGCGTGFLTEGLARALPGAAILATDIAPEMAARARARLGAAAGVRFAVMDAAAPDAEGPFDLIASSLALQWLDDPGAAMAALRARLAPGGRLMLTTLAAGSFAEWQGAGGAGGLDYPEPAALEALGLDISIETITVAYPDARDFLRGLKAIGAGTPRVGHRPLPPGAMRRAMARFEAAGAVARYVVATCVAGPLEDAGRRGYLA